MILRRSDGPTLAAQPPVRDKLNSVRSCVVSFDGMGWFRGWWSLLVFGGLEGPGLSPRGYEAEGHVAEEAECQVLVRQAKLGVSCRVQVPVGRGVGSDSS